MIYIHFASINSPAIMKYPNIMKLFTMNVIAWIFKFTEGRNADVRIIIIGLNLKYNDTVKYKTFLSIIIKIF